MLVCVYILYHWPSRHLLVSFTKDKKCFQMPTTSLRNLNIVDSEVSEYIPWFNTAVIKELLELSFSVNKILEGPWPTNIWVLVPS